MPDTKTIQHYQIHMKIYGTLIVELADHEEEVIKIMTGANSGGLLSALREMIENAQIDF